MVEASGLPSTRCVFLPWIQGCSRARAAEGRCLGSLQVHMRSQLMKTCYKLMELMQYHTSRCRGSLQMRGVGGQKQHSTVGWYNGRHTCQLETPGTYREPASSHWKPVTSLTG
jgi:hypothetical protein